MGISPYDYKGDVLSHPDCIQCAECLIACPKKSIWVLLNKNSTQF